MTRKTSKIRQEYMKQRKRLQAFQRRAEKRGFIFEQPLVSKEIPKRITRKMVNELKYMTAPRIYAKNTTEYVDADSGVIVPGRIGIEVERNKNRLNKWDIEKFTEERNKLLHDYGIDYTVYTELSPQDIAEMDRTYNEEYQQDFSMIPSETFVDFDLELKPEQYKNFDPENNKFINESDLQGQYNAKALNEYNALMQDLNEFPDAFVSKFMQYMDRIIDQVGKEGFGEALLEMKQHDQSLYDFIAFAYDSNQAFGEFSSAVIQSIPFLTTEERETLESALDEESWIEV